jgi:hypothetical protein
VCIFFTSLLQSFGDIINFLDVVFSLGFDESESSLHRFNLLSEVIIFQLIVLKLIKQLIVGILKRIVLFSD